MTSTKLFLLWLLSIFIFFPLYGQEDIENLFLRKAVKDYIVREYDNTIGDLEQVLTANPKNSRARQLMAKVYVIKGQQAAIQNNQADALTFFIKAAEYDSTNTDSRKGILEIKQRQASAHQAMAVSPSPASPVQQQSYSMQPPTTIIQAPSGGTDTTAAKVIENLLNSFNQNQKIIAQQIVQTNNIVNRSDSSKDKYLDALLKSTKQSGDTLLHYILIGGAVAILFLLIFVVVFFVFFHSVNKNAELRTIQATQSIAALLAGPSAQQSGANTLLIAGPSPVNQATATDAQLVQEVQHNSGTQALNDPDPLKRADAIEALELELVKSKENVPPEKMRLLGELLNDGNNRVRANAAKALYSIDKEASLSTLREMLKESSKRMRASAIWALGEIGSEEALEVVLSIENEVDEMITYNIKTALEKINNRKRFSLTEKHTERIFAEIAKYKEIV
jgi:hypothetical protein